MSLPSPTARMLPAIEEELHNAVDRVSGPGLEDLRYMLAYHLGWEGEGANERARGKRVRPLLLLLACAAAGGSWHDALPAAAAVELIHNFSLIHDDIEDNSDLRRGRPTVWKQWGVPQAINAGDAMFSLAHLTILDLESVVPPSTALAAVRLLQDTCLQLTQGQHLDLHYENHAVIALEAYWPMVEGKTAALLAACTELGAIIAQAPDACRQAYHRFGRSLGLAFQAQDDLLGIWGDAALTGKSAESDLLDGKKSLPVIYGLDKKGAFAARWQQGAITPAEVPELAHLLAEEGAREYTQSSANRLTRQALEALDDAEPQGEAGDALRALAYRLLERQV